MRLCVLAFIVSQIEIKSLFHNVAGKKQCGFCGEWYHSASLKRHQKEQHSGNPTEHKCDLCGKTFTTKSNFGNHMRRNHGIYKS